MKGDHERKGSHLKEGRNGEKGGNKIHETESTERGLFGETKISDGGEGREDTNKVYLICMKMS